MKLELLLRTGEARTLTFASIALSVGASMGAVYLFWPSEPLAVAICVVLVPAWLAFTAAFYAMRPRAKAEHRNSRVDDDDVWSDGELTNSVLAAVPSALRQSGWPVASHRWFGRALLLAPVASLGMSALAAAA